MLPLEQVYEPQFSMRAGVEFVSDHGFPGQIIRPI